MDPWFPGMLLSLRCMPTRAAAHMEVKLSCNISNGAGVVAVTSCYFHFPATSLVRTTGIRGELYHSFHRMGPNRDDNLTTSDGSFFVGNIEVSSHDSFLSWTIEKPLRIANSTILDRSNQGTEENHYLMVFCLMFIDS